jgi:hypothetical protein
MSEQQLKQPGKSPTEHPDLRRKMAIEEYFLLYNKDGELELHTHNDALEPVSTEQQTLLTTRPQQIQDRVDDPPVHRSCAVARLAVQ